MPVIWVRIYLSAVFMLIAFVAVFADLVAFVVFSTVDVVSLALAKVSAGTAARQSDKEKISAIQRLSIFIMNSFLFKYTSATGFPAAPSKLITLTCYKLDYIVSFSR